MKNEHFLVLDVGTTGIKAFVFDEYLDVVAKTYSRIKKDIGRGGQVEQDPNEILSVSKKLLHAVVKESNVEPKHFNGFGITNQRETTILWDKATGKPVYPAISWEDTRTKQFCTKLRKKHEKYIRSKTGLTLDTYFSASKISWILDNVPKTKKLLKENNLAFGTIDSWLLWHLSKEQVHKTDYTNASRTLLFDIQKKQWDVKLLDIFDIPKSILPEVVRSQYLFGLLKKDIVGFTIPIHTLCGDQQASMYAVGSEKGDTKITYGTGTFLMHILGREYNTQDSFFTTLVPHEQYGAVYALEAKVTGTGRKIDAVLLDVEKLKKVVLQIVKDVNVYVQKISPKPKRLMLDGGIVRDVYIADLQALISHIPVFKQKIFDGTALGVAKLISDSRL